jgi:hypothetical protein
VAGAGGETEPTVPKEQPQESPEGKAMEKPRKNTPADHKKTSQRTLKPSPGSSSGGGGGSFPRGYKGSRSESGRGGGCGGSEGCG